MEVEWASKSCWMGTDILAPPQDFANRLPYACCHPVSVALLILHSFILRQVVYTLCYIYPSIYVHMSRLRGVCLVDVHIIEFHYRNPSSRQSILFNSNEKFFLKEFLALYGTPTSISKFTGPRRRILT